MFIITALIAVLVLVVAIAIYRARSRLAQVRLAQARLVQARNSAEGMVSAKASRLVGEASKLRQFANDTGVLVAGRIDAYLTPESLEPCSRMPIESPIPMTRRNLEWIEDALAVSCAPGVRPARFVADAQVAYASIGPEHTREGFFCWGSSNARENYRGGRKGRLNAQLRGSTEKFAAAPVGCAACVGGGVAEGFAAAPVGCAACVGGGVAEGFAAAPMGCAGCVGGGVAEGFATAPIGCAGCVGGAVAEGFAAIPIAVCKKDGFRSSWWPDWPGTCSDDQNSGLARAASIESRGLRVARGSL